MNSSQSALFSVKNNYTVNRAEKQFNAADMQRPFQHMA